MRLKMPIIPEAMEYQRPLSHARSQFKDTHPQLKMSKDGAEATVRRILTITDKKTLYEFKLTTSE